MSSKFSDYLYRAGSFTLDALRESARRHDSEVTNDATDYGILITTSALYDAKVKDDVILKMLQKYWGLTENEARERLRIEKTIQHPCNMLAEYLMNEEAMSREEADRFIFSHGVVEILRSEPGVWKLSPKELLEKVK